MYKGLLGRKNENIKLEDNSDCNLSTVVKFALPKKRSTQKHRYKVRFLTVVVMLIFALMITASCGIVEEAVHQAMSDAQSQSNEAPSNSSNSETNNSSANEINNASGSEPSSSSTATNAPIAVSRAYSLNTDVEFENLSFKVDGSWRLNSENDLVRYYFDIEESSSLGFGFVAIHNLGVVPGELNEVLVLAFEEGMARTYDSMSFFGEPEKMNIAGVNGWYFSFAATMSFGEVNYEIYGQVILFVDDDQTLYALSINLPKEHDDVYNEILKNLASTVTLRPNLYSRDQVSSSPDTPITGHATNGAFSFTFHNDSPYSIYSINIGLLSDPPALDVDQLPYILRGGESIELSGTALKSAWSETEWTLFIIDVDGDESLHYDVFNPWSVGSATATWDYDRYGWVTVFDY